MQGQNASLEFKLPGGGCDATSASRGHRPACRMYWHIWNTCVTEHVIVNQIRVAWTRAAAQATYEWTMHLDKLLQPVLQALLGTCLSQILLHLQATAADSHDEQHGHWHRQHLCLFAAKRLRQYAASSLALRVDGEHDHDLPVRCLCLWRCAGCTWLRTVWCLHISCTVQPALALHPGVQGWQ